MDKKIHIVDIIPTPDTGDRTLRTLKNITVASLKSMGSLITNLAIIYLGKVNHGLFYILLSKYIIDYRIEDRITKMIVFISLAGNYQGGGGGCNPKKPYPSLTFSRVGVGFFWVLLVFLGFFWVFKKLIIFADFLYTQCENMHML